MTSHWNFGRNIAVQPAVSFQPQTEPELLTWLDSHRDRKIRCIGRLHSWSPLVACEDALLDLSAFQSMRLIDSPDGPRLRVGAGCQIKQIVAFLDRHGLTLPTLGLIDEQSIAGAISTGTHGSGRHSLSHYVRAVRMISLADSSQNATARWIDNEQAVTLQAARCSLGCLGVITEIELPTRPQYAIEEHFQRYASLAEILQAEAAYPLQQFYWAPWRWDFFAQHRVEVDAPRSWHAPLYRAFWAGGMDVAFHLLVCALARWLPRGCTRFAYRHFISRFIPMRWKVVDRSDRQLTMQHERFRHIEVEVFVPARHLSASLDFVRELIVESAAKPKPERYVQHYPICVRRVLPDDTLVSPASRLPGQSDNESWYTLSFISYIQPRRRTAFDLFATELVHRTMERFDARPHWGKFCPVHPEMLEAMYPHWQTFQAIAVTLDRNQTFRNRWLESLMVPTAIDPNNQPLRT